MKTFGLIGKNISYSFSRNYFSNKFKAEGIPAVYKNFDLETLADLQNIFDSSDEISGLNVTIPYKEEIIGFLDRLDPVAREIGAVNTIKIEKSGTLTGYNTDFFGFMESIKPHLLDYHSHALILGTGGASKAIAYALDRLGIKYKFVSRSPVPGNLQYADLKMEHFQQYKLIINCTPLGTYPEITNYPPIPTEYLNAEHLVYDLIYNPDITHLMKLALLQNATVLNGKKMLEFQAEKAWEIWNT